ncbi:MAG: 50S ribosomal protein L15 [Candidatus Omnitrophica bacterium]|nr:50S ribosomal protein L15 [Candidatus Omnitrophota bacterium]
MYLHELKLPKGARKKKKIVGRGSGSGHGKTSCRGHKGQKARSGGATRIGFEGGQMPLIRRLPKRGFRRISEKVQIINLENLNKFKEGSTITLELLKTKGLIKDTKRATKILGDGKISKPLMVKAHSFSKSAEAKIKEAGGQIEVINA